MADVDIIKHFDEKMEETKRHFDVVAENLTDEIKVVVEAVEGTNERLDRVETRFDGVETRLDGVETRLDGVETRLGGVETRLERIEGRLVDPQDFQALEKRVRATEQRQHSQ